MVRVREVTMLKPFLVVAVVAACGCAANVKPVAAPRAAVFDPAPRAVSAVVLNPTTIEFTASPDHAALMLDGTPILSRYDLKIVPEATPSAAGVVVSLGKPTPDAAGLIGLRPIELTQTPIDVRMIGILIAVGPGGATSSSPTQAFGKAGPARAPGAPVNAVVK